MVYGNGKIGRSVVISHCSGQHLNPYANDPPEFVDFEIDFFGCYTPQRATTYARRITGDSSVTINNVEHETHFYTMKLRDFVEVAERTDNNGY